MVSVAQRFMSDSCRMQALFFKPCAIRRRMLGGPTDTRDGPNPAQFFGGQIEGVSVRGERQPALTARTWTGLDFKNGRGGEIRTPDPLLPKQMRYQAALRPDSPMIPSQRQPGAFKECNNEPPSQSNNRKGSIASASRPSPSSPMNSQSFAVSLRATARLCSSR
jgi:hypothetical protein